MKYARVNRKRKIEGYQPTDNLNTSNPPNFKQNLHTGKDKVYKKMEIIDFSNKTFSEIPKQDNPAYMTSKDWQNINQDGCILITKQDSQKTPYKNCGNYCVFKITPCPVPEEQDTMEYIGLFWIYDVAYKFAIMMKNQYQTE
jgi:hypothetical protein